MSIRAELDAAAAKLQGFKRPLANAELLELYALFKQATEGDVVGSRPGMLDPRGRAKHDAWAAREGMAPEEAKRLYLEQVEEILERDG